jgi:photosystem II stability/assembly factor-like uncharacterized protein
VSEDGGATWTPAVPFGAGEERITGGDSVAGGYGWLVGSQGGVYRTVNRGDNWLSGNTDRVDVGSTYLDGVFFQSAERGWVGGGGLFARTQDGGQTWNTGPTPNVYFDDLVFLGDGSGVGLEGFLQPKGGLLWWTPDEGVTWNTVLDTTSGLRALGRAGQVLWAVGDDGQMAFSADRGRSWKPVDRGTSGRTAPTLNAVEITASAGWAVGSDGAVWRLRSGSGVASAWEPGSVGPYELRDVRVLGGRVVVAAGYNSFTDRGVILRTTDGGRSWEEVHVEPGVFFYALSGPY